MIVIKRILSEDEIYNITEAFRLVSGGCVDDANGLLAYYLLEKYNIHTKQGNGVLKGIWHISR